MLHGKRQTKHSSLLTHSNNVEYVDIADVKDTIETARIEDIEIVDTDDFQE